MNFLERQFEDPVRFARIKRWFYIGLAAVALAEIVLPLVVARPSSPFLVRVDSRLGIALWIGLLRGDHRRVQVSGQSVADAPRRLL